MDLVVQWHCLVTGKTLYVSSWWEYEYFFLQEELLLVFGTWFLGSCHSPLPPSTLQRFTIVYVFLCWFKE